MRLLASDEPEAHDVLWRLLCRTKYVDPLRLVDAGIIDPTKVVRLALENAVSAAGVLLLTEATMTEVAQPKPEAPSLEAA